MRTPNTGCSEPSRLRLGSMANISGAGSLSPNVRRLHPRQFPPHHFSRLRRHQIPARIRRITAADAFFVRGRPTAESVSLVTLYQAVAFLFGDHIDRHNGYEQNTNCISLRSGGEHGIIGVAVSGKLAFETATGRRAHNKPDACEPRRCRRPITCGKQA